MLLLIDYFTNNTWLYLNTGLSSSINWGRKLLTEEAAVVTAHGIYYFCTIILYKPFKPQNQHVYSPHYSPSISYLTSWVNLTKNQDISTLGIISSILMTCMFEQVVTL